MKIPFLNKDNNDASPKEQIISKLKEMFSPEPQKEKVLRHEDFNAAGDVYYANVSVAYKITQRILVLVLIIFLLFSLVANFGEITYDNLFYLFKDFSNAVDIESSDYDTVSYTSDQRHFFSLYRGGLAIVNPSNISVYTATGRNTLNTASQFSSPCIESNEKYFLVYDTASPMFAIYNSFARVYSETLEYPIINASFAENGSFALVTRDISHKSLVHVYNENFKRAFTVPANDYVFDVELCSDSERLAISYYDIGIGNGRTEIVIRSLANAEEITRIAIDDEFLVECGFLSGGELAIVTDSSVRIYDENYELATSIAYNNAQLTGYDVSEHGVAVSYVENSEYYVAVFDKSAALLYNSTVNDSINDIGLYDEFAFLRTDSGVIRLDLSEKEKRFLPSGQGKMLIYSADTALICGDSKAEYLVFE